MEATDRIRHRLAIKLTHRLRRAARKCAPVTLPNSRWILADRYARQVQTATVRGWHRAAERRRRDLYNVLTRHRQEIDILLRQLSHSGEPSDIASAAEIHDDLVAAEQEFSSVSISLGTSGPLLSVETDPITLDSVSLGSFQVALELHARSTASNPEADGPPLSYSVGALEPHPADADEQVTHPHVSGSQLCEGEAAPAIRRALAEGRVLDFFLLVRQVLRTYNPESAYVLLDEWDHAIACRDCGTSAREDDRCFCERCQSDLCCSCALGCGWCGETNCNTCVQTCAGCAECFCNACVTDCADCGQPHCKECQTDDRCRTCCEADQAVEEAESDDQKQAKESSVSHGGAPSHVGAASAAIHALRVGETEVGGFAISAADDPLLVEDVALVEQRCTFVTVQFDDESVADFFDQQIDAGRSPQQFGRIWVHTHPGESPLPSGTDEETFDRAFGAADWSVMFILAVGGQAYARLNFSPGPGGSMRLPVVIDFDVPFAATERGTWRAAYDEHVIDVGGWNLDVDHHGYDKLSYDKLGYGDPDFMLGDRAYARSFSPIQEPTE